MESVFFLLSLKLTPFAKEGPFYPTVTLLFYFLKSHIVFYYIQICSLYLCYDLWASRMLWTVKVTQAGWSWEIFLVVHIIGSAEGGWDLASTFQFLASGSCDSPVFAPFHVLVLSLEQLFQAYVHTKKEERGRGSFWNVQLSKESFLRNPPTSPCRGGS